MAKAPEVENPIFPYETKPEKKMKNADMPAMPLSNSRQVTSAYDENRIEGSVGLSKREYFAAMAMQALLTATNQEGTWAAINCCAEQAVKEADALLEALDND